MAQIDSGLLHRRVKWAMHPIWHGFGFCGLSMASIEPVLVNFIHLLTMIESER